MNRSLINLQNTMPVHVRYTPWLCLCFGLFIFRVSAQLIQKFYNLPFLPPFEAWYSGALVYPWLLTSQILIIVVMGWVIAGFAKGRIIPRHKLGAGLLALGSIYFVVMLFRLIAGFAFAADHPWLGAHIPAFFHIVLASFVLFVGHFHRYGNKRVADESKFRNILTWTVYPGVMVVSLGLYYGLIHYGVSLPLSSFIAAIIGGLGLITLFEIILPYRKEWLPNRNEIKTDLVFMLLIQVALPQLLTIFTTVYLVSFAEAHELQLTGFWPHGWPVWVQMLLMMFTADFLRYWLHRAAHEWIPLWRVHAVHHSVQKLYWLNVGRFHPIDKSLQFLCDALPFILLGVSKEVMTLYFVVYAIKGFFQHSNVDTKLGWLNYIISGPELHRWHHSKRVKESNSNYGNNVIVWDILFGTFFMPKDSAVAELGLFNRNYPSSFISQLKTPFIKGIDKAK